MALWKAVTRIVHPSLGGFGSNTWHLRTTGLEQAPFTGLGTLMGYLETFYQNVSNVFPTAADIVFSGTIVGVGAEEGETREVDPWTVPGNGGSGCLPPATALVVGWRSDSGGRSGRGRTFLGPLSPGVLQDDGTIDQSVLSGVRTTAGQLVDASEGFNDGAFGVYSPQDSVLRDFTSSAVRDVFAVLTSRRD